MNDKQELKKRIDASYERRVKQWMESDPAQLLDAAETIAAAQLMPSASRTRSSCSAWMTRLVILQTGGSRKMAPISLTRRSFCTVYGRSNRSLTMCVSPQPSGISCLIIRAGDFS